MLKKDITFIYMDSAEKAAYMPIAKEAEKRGYKVTITDDKFKKCEIGFYCQHVNFPQYSNFSVIMLHDIIQQYGGWPDIWFREPWNKYDIGILPSDQWVKNWDKCSNFHYTNPRKAMYKIGWPKADVIAELRENTYREDFYKKHGLDLNKKTVLYAPAWENDSKQDDFVKAMQKLDVNILIKQADWNKELYPQQVKNIAEMYELHKDVKGVTILPPATNIFEAILVSDILVSEESSTMCEAIMMGIPAVSVSDWLIPDTTPSRLPKCDYDFVFMTKKDKLSDFVSNIIKDYNNYKKQAEEYSKVNFANIGKTSAMIMDIIDDYVYNKPVRYEALKPATRTRVPIKRALTRLNIILRSEIYYNYRVRFPLVNALFAVRSKIKKVLGR